MIITIMLQTTQAEPAAIARLPDTAGPLALATPTTRKLVDASISLNSRLAYLGALRRLDAWRGSAPVDDASLAVYLGTSPTRSWSGSSRPTIKFPGGELSTTSQVIDHIGEALADLGGPVRPPRQGQTGRRTVSRGTSKT